MLLFIPLVIFFCHVSENSRRIHNICFLQKVNVLSDDQWPSVLAEYIRHNDEAMLKASERVLASYRDELLPCASFDEFCDIVGKFVSRRPRLKILVALVANGDY